MKQYIKKYIENIYFFLEKFLVTFYDKMLVYTCRGTNEYKYNFEANYLS